MATSIKVIMNDGTVRDFEHIGRGDGSYTKSITYEGAFAVIHDEWGNTTAIPASEIREIQTRYSRG